MAQPNCIRPSDQIENIKSLVSSMKLTIRGLVALSMPPTDEEEWGMYLILDNINDRLVSISDQLFEAKQINHEVTTDQSNPS